jgi:hypothetical protein
MFLVYTGRQLNRQNSFMEEFVENQSELFCLHEDNDEVQGDKREKYERRIQEEREARRKGKVEEEEGGDLWNYLPKDSVEGRKSSRKGSNEPEK